MDASMIFTLSLKRPSPRIGPSAGRRRTGKRSRAVLGKGSLGNCGLDENVGPTTFGGGAGRRQPSSQMVQTEVRMRRQFNLHQTRARRSGHAEKSIRHGQPIEQHQVFGLAVEPDRMGMPDVDHSGRDLMASCSCEQNTGNTAEMRAIASTGIKGFPSHAADQRQFGH